MDLADELLADFEEEGDFGYENERVEEEPEAPTSSNQLKRKRSEQDAADEDGDEEMQAVGDSKTLAVPEGGTKPAEELDADEVQQMNMIKLADVTKVARLTSSPAFQSVLSRVAEYRQLPPSDMSSSESAEYKLIVQANNYAVEIDNEVLLAHKFARDHYAPRFEELEQLVTTPNEYCRTVQGIGNPDDLSGLQHRLQGQLPQATLMVVVVTASTNTGRQLTDLEWQAVQTACAMCSRLESAKAEILTYVESRMTGLAPNLSAIIGSRTATKILGMAGGLSNLSRQPSCNIHLFGAQKKGVPLGLSTGSYAANRKGAGFLYNSELVQSMPEEYRMRIQRTVGAKCLLAVRMDLTQSYTDGSYGRLMLEDLHKKMDKMQEPPPAKVIKALPKPDEGPTKRRGGKRARKAKEAYAMTELRKLQNRMHFGKEEEEDGFMDETKGLGMIGQASGKLRASAGEARSKAKMSRMNKNRLAAMKASTSGGAVSGLSSSLAFTPVQGIELVDPAEQKRRLQAANDSWFKNEQSGTFSVMPGAKSSRK